MTIGKSERCVRVMKNRRKAPRISVRVFASYECYNDDGEVFENDVGVVLDVSQGGMLIETASLIDANYVKVEFVNHDNTALSIVASVVHSRKRENGKAHTGLCFHGTDSESIEFVSNLIRTYHYGKKNFTLKKPIEKFPVSAKLLRKM